MSSSWLRFGISSIISLVQMPIIFSCLPKDKVGLWFIFFSLAQFIQMTDLGISSALGRAISFIWGGKKNENESFKNHKYTDNSVSEVYSTGIVVIFTVCLVLLIIGSILLLLLPSGLGKVELKGERMAFFIFFIGVMVNLIASIPCTSLSSFGDVGLDNVCRLVGVVFSFFVIVFLLPVYRSLDLLAFSFLIQAICTLALSLFLLHSRHDTIVITLSRVRVDLIKKLYKDGIPNFITQAGVWLIFQSTMIIALFYFSTSEIADFGAMRQLAAIGFGVIFSIPNSMAPFATIKYAEGNKTFFLILYSLAIKATMFLAALWCIGILVWGKTALCFWIGPNHFLGYAVLVPLVLSGFFDMHHSVNANFVWSTGSWPFAPWSIAAGILNVLFVFIFCRFIGLPGLVVGTLVAQLSTQNWYVVYFALKRLAIPFIEYMRNIIVPILMMMIFSSALALLAKKSIESIISVHWSLRGLPGNSLIAFFAGPVVVIIFSSIGFLFFILNKTERTIIISKIAVPFFGVFKSSRGKK